MSFGLKGTTELFVASIKLTQVLKFIGATGPAN